MQGGLMVFKHLKRLHRRLTKQLDSFLEKFFKKKKDLKIGLYGPPNAGKTSVANAICMDWLGERLGRVSSMPHETREIQTKEHIEVKMNKHKLVFNLVDTPGIATKIDFENFVRKGMSRKGAKKRAKEATKGVIEAIKWLDEMDLVLVVLDSTYDPINQVNITIIGNLDAREIPVIVVANKMDLKKAKPAKVKAAFPQYPFAAVSAKKGTNMKQLYKKLFEVL